MSPDFVPAVLFATGCANANNWLTNNSTRRKPVSAVVWRALRLTEMVMQYETEDNFPDLLAAWEQGFDSLIPPTAMATTRAGHAPAAVMSVARAIDDITTDIEGAAEIAGALLDLATQECTTKELSPVFAAMVAADRYLGDIAVLTQKLRGLGLSAREGGGE